MGIHTHEHRPAWQILPMLEDLYRRFPEWRDHEPHEAQAALWSLHYVDGLLPEAEIRAALLVLRAVESQERRAA
ncbi:MAG: hypothetical protein M3R38_12760 [Actinomycetota bacterium]|nr:hypothetical protein [Actinomycetota bacterium]